MADQTKFILNTSTLYFGAIPPDDSSASAVRDFLENSELTVLAATQTNGRIRYAYRVATEETCLLFYKIPQIGGVSVMNGGEKSADPAPSLGMLTIDGGLVKSIYDSMVRVYLPQGTLKSEFSPEVEQIIKSLQLSLGSSLGFPQSGIHSVDDEIQFWKQKSNESPSKADKEKAKEFVGALAGLNEQIKNLHSNDLRALVEFLDTVHGTLDDIWRLPSKFPQNRMKDLIDIITSVIVSVCADLLAAEDIFRIDAYQVDELLTEMTEHTDSWLRLCDSLTRFFWPNNGQHQWLGDPHAPVQAGQFVERLNEVRQVKLMLQQMMAVLSNDGGGGSGSTKQLHALFGTLKDVNLFDISPFGQKRWKKTMLQMERHLQPVDERIAAIIRSKMQPYLDNPRQVIYLFSRYSAILRRTPVIQTMTAEREHCAIALGSVLTEMKASLVESNEQKSIGDECQWLKICEQQLLEMEQIIELIDDKTNLNQLKATVESVRAEVVSTLNYNFDLWKERSVAAIKSGELSLQTDRPVVEFERDGRQFMRVTFYPPLVTFCQDVRQLESLGLRIPPDLRSVCTHATAFMASARRLQQIATFHNTIGDRMVLCQRPIMLKNAIELSRLVQSESVTWNDQESVDGFVSRLQVAVNQLSKDNAYLAGQHEAVKKIILKLMTVDLLRQDQVWKDEMRRLRDIMTGLETNGYQNLQGFKLHWDHQLYKVFEFQYLSGLADMSNKLPDIHVELVFRQQELQFRPAFEEIRLTYFQQLRRFLDRPLTFRGLSDNSGSLFKQMIDRNSGRFADLYLKSAKLFEQLRNMQRVWRPWIVLGLVNLEDLCAVHLVSWEDWDKNFKSCKHFSQQIAKIEATEHRVDCFVISVGQLRSEIEYISRKYWDTLAKSLKVSILHDIEELQTFVHSSLQFLQNVPLDDVGIAEAGAKYEKIMSGLPEMRKTLASVERKDTCLAGWCKERVSSLGNLVTQWDQLQPLIENHSIVLQRQIDIMRDHIESRLASLQEETEKFEIRWETTVADLRTNEVYNSKLFHERQASWSAIQENRMQLEIDCAKFNIAYPTELQELFEKVDKSVETECKHWEEYEKFLDECDAIGLEEWTVYRRRPYILTDFIAKWDKIAASSNNASSTRVRQSLESYQKALPVLQTMQSDGLTERHWDQVFGMMKKSLKPLHEILLKDMLGNSAELVLHAGEIQTLVRQAASEQVVRQALTELDQWASSAVLNTLNHIDSRSKELILCKDFQEVLNKIGDNQCLLQSAKNSSSFDAFSDRVTIWESRLMSLEFLLTNLSQIQRKWIYLEPIFNNGTMRTDETAFKRIDKDFRYIMKCVADDPRLMSIIKISNVTTIIESLELQLGRCQNSLTSYILTKREAFPRFYFLADDDLLEILGQSSKPDIVQKHIGKLFPGVHRLGLDTTDSKLVIRHIESAEGDRIALIKTVPVTEAVEVWLNQLIAEIRNTLIQLMVQCSRLTMFGLDHIETYPVQVLCTARAIAFTGATIKSIQSMSLALHLQKLQLEIEQLNGNDYRSNNVLTQSKIRSLMLDMVHYVAVVQMLIRNNVTTTTDWHWLQQMQFFLNSSTQLVTVRMVYAEFEYSYEYLGNSNKLVHTTLTHHCYLTLTQAMQLGLGGNPFGPAGTGKTECVKSLGSMLGRLVLVFNCSENMDAAAMELILSGLARCGAWGCFDEFNRLQEATLSAISMMIQPLQVAIKAKESSVAIGSDKIPLNLHCCIFVTLNPAGEEYGGRQNLPTNLQSLFRPIVMQQPEPRDIARVLLFAERFHHADIIGGQLVEVFQMAQEILSPQRHYDWGLRELRTVLMACGKGRAALQMADQEKSVGLAVESTIVVRALRSNTMSKLSRADCSRFDMLINSIFPNITWTDDSDTQFRRRIGEAFGVLGLRSNPEQVGLCLQLHEQLMKRTGIVVLGPPRSGKSTIVSVLKQALSSEHAVIRTYTISPKSMTRDQLLGRLDPDTRQWQDGVLTSTAVVVNNEPPNVTSWIICDGDVDPEWIEALNSVLDDNKLLTLPSGWRIQFGNNVNFIFETHDLRHASPATISRMGIISLNAEDLKIENLLETWLLKEASADTNSPLPLFVEKYLQPSLLWIQSKSDGNLKSNIHQLIQQCLPFMKAIDSKEEFAVALIRGVGGGVQDVEVMREFCEYVLELSDVRAPSQAEPELTTYNSMRKSIETYALDEIPMGRGGSDSLPLIVRTGHMKVYADVLRNFLENEERRPFAICGPSGSGKTLLLQHVVTEFSGYQLVTITCSAQLTTNFVLYTLKQHLMSVSGLRGREYRPKLKRVVFFFKNIHLCLMDSWGTSAVVELLMQLIQRNGVYDSDTSEWITVTGCQIASSTSASIGSNDIPVRLCALFRVLMMHYPSAKDMQAIFQHQMSLEFQRFNRTHAQIEQTVDVVLTLYAEICKAFPGSRHTHYVFNPKMLSTCIRAMAHYPVDQFEISLFNEIVATFRNRLASQEDCGRFNEIMVRATRFDPQAIGKEFVFVPTSQKSSSLDRKSHEEWIEIVQRNVTVCGTESIHVDIPVSTQLLQDVANFSRILSRPSGHLTLCGPIGSGQTVALHVACTMLQLKTVSPVPVAKYSMDHFYNDLRMVIQSAALEDQTIVFHIEQSWLGYLPEAMRPIEAILQGSEIPELFGDDLENLVNPLRGAANLSGYQESLVSFFWMRVKANLHLVITLEPGVFHRELFKQYHSIYRNAEVIFIQPLNPTELTDWANQSLRTKKPDAPAALPGRTPIALSGVWSESPLRIQQLVRTFAATHRLFATTHSEQTGKFRAGVDKLSATHAVVDDLKEKAKLQEEAMLEKKDLASKALDQITLTMRNANDQRSNLQDLHQQTQASREKLLERKAAIEVQLQEVEPILREATAAVGAIKGEALSEIRSLRAPPEVIRDILEGVLRLMGVRDTSWNSMKSFLAKRGVKEDIRCLDPVRITPENCSAVETLLNTKAESFMEKNARRASAAAAPLASWVIANVRYARVIQSIKPLEREQNRLQENLAESEGHMQSLTSGLDDVDTTVKKLSEQLNRYTQEAAVLEIQLSDARSTLKAAEVLVDKLSAEYSSWLQQLATLDEDQHRLDSKAFLIAYAITHLSHYTYDRRCEFLEEMRKHMEVPEFQLTQNIITEQDQIVWESMGLSSDQQTMESAAILSKIIVLPFGSTPTPMLLDPSGCALIWLQEYLTANSTPFECVLQDSERFAYTLELAVRFGKCLIVRDFERVQPPLMPILIGTILTRFNKKALQVGSKTVDLHENFRLILTTKMEHFDLPNDVGCHVSCVPFTTTVTGYTGQLISHTVQLKQPELEAKRIELLQLEGRLLKQRTDLRDRLLRELSTAQGDVLKNEALLSTLTEVKESSRSIEVSLAESSGVRSQLMEQFAQYRPMCEGAARFYIEIRRIYNVSVTVFTELFLKSIESQEAFLDQDPRGKLARLTFARIARSIPRAQHTKLGLLICKFAFTNQVSEKEWESFITNLSTDTDQPPRIADIPTWIKPEQAPKVEALAHHHPEIYNQLDLNSTSKWKPFMQSTHLTDVPANISNFQKILVTQCLRPDLLLEATEKLVCKMLSLKSISVAKPTLKQMCEETKPIQPILLISTADDADPSKEIQELMVTGLGRYVEMSLGRGQEKAAMEALDKALANGAWICLKNLQLVAEWLPTLNQKLDTLSDVPAQYRLWLISDSMQSIPEALLQKCNALLYESPSGVKHKTLSLLQKHQPRLAQYKDAKRLKLRVLMCILNSVLQERRRYLPEGWSRSYDFGDADLDTAMAMVDWLDGVGRSSSFKVDWMVLQGLCKHLAYGGRISNQQDIGILDTHLEAFLNEQAVGSDRWRPLQFQQMRIPQSVNVHEYMTAISEMGEAESPGMLGLSGAANVTRDIVAARNMLKQLRSNHYLRSDTKSSIEKRFKPMLSLWKKLVADTDLLTLDSSTSEPSATENPWQTFVYSELQMAAKLVRSIHTTLLALYVAVKEVDSMSAVDLSTVRLIADNQVPLAWRQIWPAGPKVLTDFLRLVVGRGQSASKRFKDRVDNKIGQFGGTIPLNGVLNLHSLLYALKLTNASELNYSASDLVISSSLSHKHSGPKTRPSITALKIDGASFRGGKLIAATTAGDYDDSLPELQIFYASREEAGAVPTGYVRVPVYTNATREHLLCTLPLETGTMDAQAIVLAGVAVYVAE